MPLSVLNGMEVIYCLPLVKMGEVIFEITQTEREEKPAPPDVMIESEIAERVLVDYEHVRTPGKKSIFGCHDVAEACGILKMGAAT